MHDAVISLAGEKSMDDKRLRHGRGVYRFQYQGFAYDGDWVEGVKQGRGLLTMPDGSSYNGEFLEGEVKSSSALSCTVTSLLLVHTPVIRLES